jgi:hypothetical protein
MRILGNPRRPIPTSRTCALFEPRPVSGCFQSLLLRGATTSLHQLTARIAKSACRVPLLFKQGDEYAQGETRKWQAVAGSVPPGGPCLGVSSRATRRCAPQGGPAYTRTRLTASAVRCL